MSASASLNPGRLLGISGFYWQTCTLHAGVKLDVFTIIDKAGSLDANGVAQDLNAPLRSTSMLLNALTAMGLLVKNGNRFSNTSESSTFLSKESPDYVGFIIQHHHHLVSSWARLDHSVKTGTFVRSNVSHDDDEHRESFLMGMFNIAMSTAPKLVPTIDLTGKKRLLDLGGGPGTYAIFFCNHNPDLSATVFDLETTKPFARKTIQKFNLKDRVCFEPGNYLTDPLKGRYDVVWLSHILHGEPPEDCEAIIKKAVSVLEPGGLIIIHEFILDNTKDRPLFPALFSLNMLLGTEGGAAYSEEELFSMLTNAGITRMERTSFKGPMESGIIIGTNI